MRMYAGARRSVKKRGVRETRGQIRNQVSIDQRPHSVETLQRKNSQYYFGQRERI